MQVGTLIDIVFETGDQRILTFAEMTRSASGVWAVHSPLHAPPRPQFISPGQGGIEFIIHLSSQLGVNPIEEIEKVENHARTGEHGPFLLGRRPVTQGDWYIEQCETTMVWVNSRGETEFANISLTVKEYF